MGKEPIFQSMRPDTKSAEFPFVNCPTTSLWLRTSFFLEDEMTTAVNLAQSLQNDLWDKTPQQRGKPIHIIP